MPTGENVFYQTESRIARLETSVSSHEKEISEIKQTHKEVVGLLFNRLESMTNEIHVLSMSYKDSVISQQRWMIGVVVGFVAQTAVGILLLIIKRGGL